MLWNEWQAWRRSEGLRPTKELDGVTTIARQESALWRRTMETLYGPDWRRLYDDREAAIADGENPPPVPLKDREVREPPPSDLRTGTVPGDAGAAPTDGQQQAVTEPPTASGENLPVPVTPRARSPRESYTSSRLGSPQAEDMESLGWRSSEPGTPGNLSARILRPFDPARDTLDEYCNRLDKQVEALAGLAATGVGQEVDSSVIARLKDTAQVHLIMKRDTLTARDEI